MSGRSPAGEASGTLVSEASPVAPPHPADAAGAASIGAVDVLFAAAWLGILSGILEGAGMLLFQQLVRSRYVSIDTLWIAPMVNGLLFIAIGGVLALAMRLHPRLQSPWVGVFPLLVLLAINILEVIALSSYIAIYAVALLAMGLAVVATRWLIPRQRRVLRFWRRSAPWLGVATVMAWLAITGGVRIRESRAVAALPATPADQPNVLLIVLDALRSDHLGSYGYHRPTSPNFDRLAGEGVLYENAFASSPWSLPSHASLFTGRFPSEMSFGWSDPRALQRGTQPTLPEVMKAHGYRTAAVSANVFWVTHDLFGRGFMRFYDYYHSAADMALRTNFGRAFERFVLQRLGIEDVPARKRASHVNRDLLRWIDRHPDRPFFAFANYFDVHDPYLPPRGYESRFSSLPESPGILNWRVGRADPTLTPEQLQGEIDAYDELIVYMDEALGHLRQELEARQLLDNTIIIVVSDHGEAWGEHGWYLHGHSLYRELLQIPMMVRWPGVVPANTRVEEPVSIVDVPAIVVDLIGGDHAFPGKSHRALWSGAAGDADTHVVYAETERKPWAPEGSPSHVGWMRSLIDPNWQFIEQESGRFELYQWKLDRLQQRDLSTSPEGPGVIRSLRERSPLQP